MISIYAKASIGLTVLGHLAYTSVIKKSNNWTMWHIFFLNILWGLTEILCTRWQTTSFSLVYLWNSLLLEVKKKTCRRTLWPPDWHVKYQSKISWRIHQLLDFQRFFNFCQLVRPIGDRKSQFVVNYYKLNVSDLSEGCFVSVGS